MRQARAIGMALAPARSMVYHDPLTGLPNRGLLQDRLTLALAASAGSGQWGALCWLNIKNFRALNMSEGHEIGDQILMQLSARLSSVARDGNMVARLWGDEFLILLEDLGSTAAEATRNARLLAERVRNAMRAPMDLPTYHYACRLRIGISLFQAPDKVTDVFKRTALALQETSTQEADSLCFFDPMMQSQQEQRNTLLAELTKAVLWQQFCIYYQPQVDHREQVVGVEALIRWQHPLHGLVPPNTFIPLAEEVELILPIGLWVLRTACVQLKLWEQIPLCGQLQVSVNVSVRQFQQPTFVAQVQAALLDSGAKPELLKLELTESLMLENLDDVVGKMQQIRRLGVRFSLDDFGTGYSSLAHLANLPIDQLKIDRSFVHNIPGKSSDEMITRTIIAMGRGLGMEVIAEGVETQAQHAFLASNGCNVYQGYLFGRPVSPDVLEALMQQAHTARQLALASSAPE